MIEIDYILLLIIGACGIGLFIPKLPRFMRPVLLLVVLACGLLGVGGVRIVQRFAWYSVKRAEHVAYQGPEKRIFQEGVMATSESAHRFVPILLSSLIVLAAAAIHGGRPKKPNQALNRPALSVGFVCLPTASRSLNLGR